MMNVHAFTRGRTNSLLSETDDEKNNGSSMERANEMLTDLVVKFKPSLDNVQKAFLYNF